MVERPCLGLDIHTLQQFPWLRWALADDWDIARLENPFTRVDAAAGWGARTAGAYARAIARRRGVPCYTLEDGFYRSVGLGKAGARAFSVILDQSGIYFDARAPSDLETMVLGSGAAEETLGAALRAFIVEHRLTKYNQTPPGKQAPRAASQNRRILLIDQVAGDQSLVGAGASQATFTAMLADARATGAEVSIKQHPDVIAGYASGMLPIDGAVALAPECDLDALLSHYDEVWTVSSQVGFEALMRGKAVRCYGVAFYAAWGLTHDEFSHVSADALTACARRAVKRPSLDMLVGCAVGRYPLYIDPVRQARCTPIEALRRLTNWRDRHFAHQGRVLCVGIARHKQALMRAHLGAAGATAKMTFRVPGHIDFSAYDEIVSWSDRLPPSQIAAARAAGVRVTFVEDGFIRSRGLSSKTNLPLSLAIDRRALHFDGANASDLEHLLQTASFSPELLERAARLRRQIVERGISKYNLASANTPSFREPAAGRPVVLVIAQVPGDASLRLGLSPFTTNLDFLRAVRRDRPEAYIVYKEHPDLVSGLRKGETPVQQLEQFADCVITEGDTTPLFKAVDEVAVMTSLAGFEALLRGLSVTCYGLPFYAGWGLTHEKLHCVRRTRKLSIDQLVAGALIAYPVYLLPDSMSPCDVEDIMIIFG